MKATISIFAILAVAAIQGCQTTTAADGTTTVQYDRAAAEAAYAIALQAYAMWQSNQDRRDAEYIRELQRREATLNAALEVLRRSGWVPPVVDTLP